MDITTLPESVAYDPEAKVLYVSEFGSQLKPTLKDGKGKISKVSLSGKVLEETFLPAAGGTLNKPKGIWVNGNRLWVWSKASCGWCSSRSKDQPTVTFDSSSSFSIGEGLFILIWGRIKLIS